MDKECQELFDTQIVPRLHNINEERQVLRRRALTLVVPLVTGWLLCFSVGIDFMSGLHPMPVLIALGTFAAIGALIIGGATLNHASKSAEQGFAKDIGQMLSKHAFHGEFEYQPSTDFLPTEYFSSLGGIRLSKTPKFRYGLSGEWKGQNFRMVNAIFSTANKTNQAEQSSGQSHSVYFNGLIVKIAVHKAMPIIIICEATANPDRLRRRHGQNTLVQRKVKIDAFSEHYGLWTDDPQSLGNHDLSALVEGFMKIHDDYSRYTGAMSATFDGCDFYLTIRHSVQSLSDEFLFSKGKCAERYAESVSVALDQFSVPCRVIETFSFLGAK